MSCEIRDRLIDSVADWIEEGIIEKTKDGKLKTPLGNTYPNSNSYLMILYKETLEFLKYSKGAE